MLKTPVLVILGCALLANTVSAQSKPADADYPRKPINVLIGYAPGGGSDVMLSMIRPQLERVPEELCRHIGREVAKGLAAIHATGVVHRDMKPENVLITRDHVVKVTDLGVALAAEGAARRVVQ